MKFGSFFGSLINESAIYPSHENFVNSAKEGIRLIEQAGLQNSKVIWRGMSYPSPAPVITMVNDRDTRFRGSQKPVSKVVIDKLKITNLTFATKDRQHASFFGTLNAMLPLKPYVSFQSREVYDLAYMEDAAKKYDGHGGASWSDKDIERLVKSSRIQELYKTYSFKVNNIVDVSDKNEILFDIKKYMLVNVGHLVRQAKDRYAKYAKYTDPAQVVTYKDVIDVLQGFIDWQARLEWVKQHPDWLEKKQKEEEAKWSKTK
jgi:hypothetical protein